MATAHWASDFYYGAIPDTRPSNFGRSYNLFRGSENILRDSRSYDLLCPLMRRRVYVSQQTCSIFMHGHGGLGAPRRCGDWLVYSKKLVWCQLLRISIHVPT